MQVLSTRRIRQRIFNQCFKTWTENVSSKGGDFTRRSSKGYIKLQGSESTLQFVDFGLNLLFYFVLPFIRFVLSLFSLLCSVWPNSLEAELAGIKNAFPILAVALHPWWTSLRSCNRTRIGLSRIVRIRSLDYEIKICNNCLYSFLMVYFYLIF